MVHSKKRASKYQQPQWYARKVKTAAVSKDEVKGSADSYVIKDELKQTKRCLCVVSVLTVILFLTTASSLGLAAYCFSSIRNGNDLEYQLNMINSEVISQGTFVNKLETQLNTTNAEVISQGNFINALNSQLNGINLEVSTLPFVRGLVTNLQSQLGILNTNITSLHSALRSQPRK